MTSRLLAVGLSLLGGAALAQGAQTPQLNDAYSAERLRVGLTREALLDTEWAAIRDGFGWDVGLMLGYAHNPVVLYRTGSGERVAPLLQNRFGGSLVGAVGFGPRFQLGLEVPMVFVNERPTQAIEGVTFAPLPSIAGVGLGDMRVMPKVGILEHKRHGVDLAAMVHVTLPTSGGARYLGSLGLGLTPEVAVSRPLGNWRLAGNVGATFRTAEPVVSVNQRVDNELDLRLAGAYRFNQLDPKALPLELGLTGQLGFSLERPFARANQTPLEGRAYAAYDVTPFAQLFGGFGVGFLRGYGVPDVRFFLGARFFSADKTVRELPKPELVMAAPDPDHDGVLGDKDLCPTQPEDQDRFEDQDGCPDPDNDKDGVKDVDDACRDTVGPQDNVGCPDADGDQDGVADRVDQCATELEDRDGFEDQDGCPDPDNDKDGVKDFADACVNVAGVAENRGCPDVDTDGDTVVDRLDNCPKEPGKPEQGGCMTKQLSKIESGRIAILEQVYFKLNKADIEARSFPLLDNVASILKDHPEIGTMRVEGHTDSQGDDASNLKLSQARADAVKAYLVKKGVEAGRLVAEGFGETKPLATNDTVEGRAKNRRVEFNIVGDAAGVQKQDKGPSSDTFEKKK